METTGIRKLKNNLSRYVRRIEAGERFAVTAHGRVVAEFRPPTDVGAGRDPLSALIAAGLARPPVEDGDPLAGWPTFKLPSGTAAALLEADRAED
jgi:antitoxin (DNA-binding transcriptional repressor) of toxin-antitoxin stability system